MEIEATIERTDNFYGKIILLRLFYQHILDIKVQRIYQEFLSENLLKLPIEAIYDFVFSGWLTLTAEKSKEVVEDLVKKGELTVEQGKVLNEELKHNVAEKLRKPVSVETVEKDLQNMDVEDLETLKAKIEELQKAKNETNE